MVCRLACLRSWEAAVTFIATSYQQCDWRLRLFGTGNHKTSKVRFLMRCYMDYMQTYVLHMPTQGFGTWEETCRVTRDVHWVSWYSFVWIKFADRYSRSVTLELCKRGEMRCSVGRCGPYKSTWMWETGNSPSGKHSRFSTYFVPLARPRAGIPMTSKSSHIDNMSI